MNHCYRRQTTTMGNAQLGKQLYEACSRGDETSALELLQQEVAPGGETLDFRYADPESGEVAMHWSCYHGKRELSLALLTKVPGFLFVQTQRGKTPMDYARSQGFVPLAEMLDAIVTKARVAQPNPPAAALPPSPQQQQPQRPKQQQQQQRQRPKQQKQQKQKQRSAAAHSTTLVAQVAARSDARRAADRTALARHNPFAMAEPTIRRRQQQGGPSSSSAPNPFDMSSDTAAMRRTTSSSSSSSRSSGSGRRAAAAAEPSPLHRGGAYREDRGARARAAAAKAKKKSKSRRTRRELREASVDRRSDTQRFRDRLAAFYRDHCPEKLGDIESLSHKYAGREDELFEALEEKYGEEELDYDDVTDRGLGPGYSGSSFRGGNRAAAETIGLSRLVGVVFPGVKPAFETVQQPILSQLVQDGVLTREEALAQEKHYKQVWAKLRDGV